MYEFFISLILRDVISNYHKKLVLMIIIILVEKI
jgi:hypothetical protein